MSPSSPDPFTAQAYLLAAQHRLEHAQREYAECLQRVSLPEHVGKANKMVCDHSPEAGNMVQPKDALPVAREEYAKLSDANAALLLELEARTAKADVTEQELAQTRHQLKLWIKRCLSLESDIVAQQNRTQRAEDELKKLREAAEAMRETLALWNAQRLAIKSSKLDAQ